MSNTAVVNFFSRGLCLAAVGLCAYGFFVMTAKQQNPKYAPYCDIDAQFNCTNYLTSKHVKGFGLVGKYLGDKSPVNQPNSFYGLGLYAVLILLSFLNYVLVARFSLLLVVSSLGVVSYINYVSYVLLKQVCPIEAALASISLLLVLVTLVKINKLKGVGGQNKNKNKKKKQK